MPHALTLQSDSLLVIENAHCVKSAIFAHGRNLVVMRLFQSLDVTQDSLLVIKNAHCVKSAIFAYKRDLVVMRLCQLLDVAATVVTQDSLLVTEGEQ
jgi:hypothetical protein